ncbi:MAG TPA: hypothetical protein VFH69_02045, partial [Gemmatimonadota bacterium]|nr:hypothetical protein [Gemmatimonadota bacterium]
MRTRNRFSLLVFGSLALAIVIWACQMQDGSFPTEGERSIQQAATCDPALATEIRGLINTVITDPIVGKSVTSQFNAIVKACPKNLNDAISKTKSTTDFILKHFTAGKWTDADGTGELVAAMFEFVGLAPEADAATTCVPNQDCALIDQTGDVLTGSEFPGDVITQTFVLFVTRLPDDFAPPPLFPAFYDYFTIPAGITFPTAPSGSLTLAQFDDQAVVAVCTLDEEESVGTPANAVPGQNLF